MKILLLGSHLNSNLEHYTQMNFQKMGHKVMFYGYREKLGKLATHIRMTMCRSSFRKFIHLITLEKINEEIQRIAQQLRLVIITKVPQIAFEIEKNRADVAINYSKRDLVDAVLKLLIDDDLYGEFSENAIEYETKFGWAKIFNEAFLKFLHRKSVYVI